VGRLWLFLLLAWLTQNPVLALAAVLLLSVGSYGYLTGRMFGIGQWIRDWQAMRTLNQTLAVASHDLRARAELGRLLVRRGRDAEAIPVLEPAVGQQPDLAGVQADFGLALLRSGRVEEGERHLEQALALDPRLRYGDPLLRWADAASGLGDSAKAIRLLERHRELHSSSVEGLYKLARACILTGDRARARAALDTALSVYRTSPRFKRRSERGWWLASHLLRWRIG